MGNNLKKIHVAVSCYLANMSDFFDIMILTIALPYIINDFNLTLAQGGLLGTATLIGCGISVFLWGWFSDNYGRKRAIVWSVALFSVLTAAIAFTQTFTQILVLRFFGGISLGGITALLGIMVNENFEPERRGTITSILFTSSAVAITVTGLVSGKIIPAYGWRTLFLISLVAIIFAVYTYFFVPESEVWKKAKEERKLKNQEAISLATGLKMIFSGKYAKITILGSLASFFAQLTYWGYSFWLPSYLKQVLGATQAQVSTVVAFQSIGLIVSFIIFGILADKIGRRKTMMILFIPCALVIPVFMSITNITTVFWMAPIVCALWVYPSLLMTFFSESYPTEVRALGVSFNFNFGRALSALGPVIGGALAATLGLTIVLKGLFVVYILAGVCISFMPETFKKKGLNEA